MENLPVHFMHLKLFLQLEPGLKVTDATTLILKRLNSFVEKAQVVVCGFEAQEVEAQDLPKSTSPSKQRKSRVKKT